MIVKTNGYLEEYYQACKSGEIVVGFELLLELEKLIQDLDSDEYIFDTTEADRRINFIENCIRLTKSPFYGQPMKLLLFQKAFITALYSFKMKDGTDRFQRIILLIARKNGKSELCSALVLTEMIIGGSGLDIVCSSNDDIQASILTDAVDTMRLMIDPEQIDTWRNQRGMKCLINNNKVFKLSDKTRNKEGRNIDVAVIDEVHEMKENIIVKSIEQSQSLKVNPKLILITTEGFVNDGFLDNELIRARAILNDEINDKASKRYLIWLYTQDEESEVWNGNRENKLWEKSNPTLGKVKRYSYLEQQIDLARGSKADRSFVLSKDFNIKQSNAEAWLNLEDYDYEETFNLDDFKNALCLGSVDIAETTDLCSARILLMKPNDSRKYIHSMYFIPEGKLLRGNDDKGAGAKYQEWAKQGILRICEGNYIDTSIIADWYFFLYNTYGFRCYMTGYDSRFANEFINKMEAYGFETDPIWQRAEVLSQPINMTEADLKDRLIIGLNEIDKWCLGNSALKMDNRGLVMLEKVKGQASRKIDGAVSLVMLLETYRRNRTVLEQNLN
jgi:phage terminase large subunit-like protein